MFVFILLVVSAIFAALNVFDVHPKSFALSWAFAVGAALVAFYPR